MKLSDDVVNGLQGNTFLCTVHRWQFGTNVGGYKEKCEIESISGFWGLRCVKECCGVW